MQKPSVYLIQKAFHDRNAKAKLPGSLKLATTVILIKYFKEDEEKFMVVDCCQVVNWPNIYQEIKKITGDFDKITHLLLTHTHLDHLQNIKEFNGKILFLANKTSIIGEYEYGSTEIYPDGYIEIPQIQYLIINDAHSHDDTAYIIDTENEGKVAILGDLIYASLNEMPIDELIKMEDRSSVDPIKKYIFIKSFYKNHPEIIKYYTGHGSQPMARKDMLEYINSLNKKIEETDSNRNFLSIKK